jgi:Lrp/AsnC family transcriptional regulator, leucine-responsive regulatory protein
MTELTKQDRVLLAVLQKAGRITNAGLSKLVHLAEAPTWRRVRALEAAGVIRSYHARIDEHALGYEVKAFVQLRFSSHAPDVQREFERQVVLIPEVLWCHNVSGATDFLLCVVARNLNEYGELVSQRLRALPGVTAIESSFSLKAIKDDGLLPVG